VSRLTSPSNREIAAALLCGLLPTLAFGHGGARHDVVPWTFDAWVTVPLVASLLLFLLGHRRLRRRSARPREHHRNLRWFLAGWIVLAGALVTPLHAAGERSFAAHMLEHELLMLVAAPLLVMSRPVGIGLWAFPDTARAWLAATGRRRGVGAVWHAATDPVVATFVQAAVLWGWHAPAAFDLALARPGWHVAQHACFLVSALLFWWAILQGRGRQRAAVAVGCLFFTSIVSGALGALMAVSEGPWYSGYEALGLDAFGLTPAEDQQLAGLLMWVPGGLVHAAVGLGVLARLLRLAERAASSVPHAPPEPPLTRRAAS
jgi:putative membrane protein